MSYEQYLGKELPGRSMVPLGWISADGNNNMCSWEGDDPVYYGVMIGYDLDGHGPQPPPFGSKFIPCVDREEAVALAPKAGGTVVFGWFIEDQAG